MPSTRREFLSQAAQSVAVAGLGPGIASVISALEQAPSSRPYLELALRCAQWIDSSAQSLDGGIAWPADPLKPASIGLDYYNGMPGIVVFYANLARATGDLRWRTRAEQGARYLVAQSHRSGDKLSAGLYTGLAGLVATYTILGGSPELAPWTVTAKETAAQLAARARTVGDGVEWLDSNDIISGTAGIGLLLHHVALQWNDKTLADLSIRAGKRLIRTAQPAEGGLMWFPSATLTQRNYPNFSHGTAGVAYFLATLYGSTKDKVFLDASLAGAKYLDAIATRRNGARAIFHLSDGGTDRFYLSWCHGPVGTARLFHRLYLTTGDAQWRQWIDELTAWVVQSGAPEQQSAGYWNNVSQCCGAAGIGQYCIDLTRHYPPQALAAIGALRQRVATYATSRATDDAAGLRWVQAENRTQPENLVAQTGFMQGAAGMGMFFLNLDASTRQSSWPSQWPDSPWG
jgi:lantibiotic modifying enzyme